jgi:hypothetical protein
MLQTISRQMHTKRLPKQFQPAQSVAAKQDERMVARTAVKACNAIERNLERRHAHALRGLACYPNDTFMRATSVMKKKQGDMQTISSDEATIEMMCAFDHLSQTRDAGRFVNARNNSKKDQTRHELLPTSPLTSGMLI